jgi:PAS domain S-box-containing protein
VYDKNGKKIGILAVGKDVTDRKRAEQSLKQSEQFYRSLIADSLDGIMLLDASGTITFVSPSIRHILGFEPEDVTGNNAFSYVHPADFNWALQSFEKEVAENRAIKFITVRLLRKNGEWLWCTVCGHNLLDNPYVNSIAIYFYDDTLRKTASDALKASEHRFRKLISDLHVGVILYDNKGKVILCNKMVQDMHNTTEQELADKDIYEVITETIHEDGRPFLVEERPLYKALKYKKTVKDVVMGIKLVHNKH